MGELINGRTPEEIKSGILCSNGCCDCPYAGCINEDETCSEYVEKDTLALIEHLEAKVPKWISVEERLPDTRGIYLAHIVHRYCKVDSYSRVGIEYFSEDKKWDSLCDIYEITHWMPMPEPPKEE